jgi:S-adenosylmethionine hydrolase
MTDPLITLTTDFGMESPYVAAMKGVILDINPRARLVDLSHEIPPQDIRYAALFLAASLPYFPAWSLHVVVIDPGVGTERALLYVELGKLRLLVPDNGCWTGLQRLTGSRPSVIRLAEPAFWRQPVSATFHGRDILAPVAGHLSLGIDPNRLGPPAFEWVQLPTRLPKVEAGRVIGEVQFVDHFGNLLTNIPAEAIQGLSRPLRIAVGDCIIDREVTTYGQAEPGTPVFLISSTGLLEIAISQGNAAEALHLQLGTQVTVTGAAVA